jgi:DNA (cytosine-5)-methyltransferase 1
MGLTVGSLFSGIGGLDLGLERAGMNVIWQSEIDPYACRVLKKHWPEVPNHGDIKLIDWSRVERPAVICGGYPCQPFSTAGHRKGEEDPRHLWPWVRQAISELQPDYAILENVRGHLSLGGTTVIADLAAIGYDAEWRIVSAASVGANHRRDRIIIVAYPNNSGPHSAEVNPTETGEYAQRRVGGCRTDVAHTDSQRRKKCDIPRESTLQGRPDWADDARNVADTEGGFDVWGHRISGQNRESVYGRVNFGRGTQGYEGWQWWETEPDVGRVADGVPARVDRLRGLGNAVVPQVAEVIGRLVVAHAQHN